MLIVVAISDRSWSGPGRRSARWPSSCTTPATSSRWCQRAVAPGGAGWGGGGRGLLGSTTEQPRRTVIRPLTPTDPDPNLSPTLRSQPLKGRQSVEHDEQPLHPRARIPGKDPPCALPRQQSVFNTPQKHVPSGGSGIVHARPFRIVSDKRRRQQGREILNQLQHM